MSMTTHKCLVETKWKVRWVVVPNTFYPVTLLPSRGISDDDRVVVFAFVFKLGCLGVASNRSGNLENARMSGRGRGVYTAI